MNVRIGVDEKVLNEPSKYRIPIGMKPSEKKHRKQRLVQIEERKKQGLSYDDLLVDMEGRRAAKAKREEEEKLMQQEEMAQQADTQLRVPKQKPRVVQQQVSFHLRFIRASKARNLRLKNPDLRIHAPR